VRAPVPWKWIALFAAVKLGVTMSVADRYGWHRDELYYLASSHHLALGYVDYPPIVPLLAAADQAVAPGSLIALRLLAALAGTVIVVLTALIARELGARGRAQAWAALAALMSPMFLGGNLMFQTVAFDEMVWAVALLIFARALRDGERQMWPVLGLVIGIGLETKFTIAALPVAMFLGILVSRRRGMLASPWPWLGAAVAVLLFLPNLAWQATHDWISVQYTISHHGNTDGPVAYWLQQLLLFNPLFLVPGVAGIVALRRDSRLAPLVYTVAGVELIFFAAGGKSYYPAPIYPVIYAAGSIWLDERLRSRVGVAVFATASIALILVLLPLGLPVLPTQTMVSMNIWQTRKDYAEMIGWPELVQQTAQVYDALPTDQKAGAMILTQNYGEAGAIDYYGPAMGLPSAVSPHLTFWYWAPPRIDPSTVVMIGFDPDTANRYFETCRQAATVTNSLGIQNQEFGGPILVCTNPRRPLWQVWGSLQALD
jgi:4-amino-4-deoxy-L-arabinose transferase-like glycosyltransferase